MLNIAGCGEVIAETYNYNGQEYNETLKNIVNLMVQLGAVAAGRSNDNKIAVEVKVDGLNYPVYFCKKDNRFCITKEINPMDRQEPIKIRYILE
jgi:hypothetical protein